MNVYDPVLEMLFFLVMEDQERLLWQKPFLILQE